MDVEWNKEEDEICCQISLEEYVIKKGQANIDDIANKIKAQAEIKRERTLGAIKMRIQNEKAVLEELNIENTIPLGILKNYSKQTDAAVRDFLSKHNLISK